LRVQKVLPQLLDLRRVRAELGRPGRQHDQ
jgi:hypothetical protein